MINPFFTKEKVADFENAQTSDTEKFASFFWEMMKNGVFYHHLNLKLGFYHQL